MSTPAPRAGADKPFQLFAGQRDSDPDFWITSKGKRISYARLQAILLSGELVMTQARDPQVSPVIEIQTPSDMLNAEEIKDFLISLRTLAPGTYKFVPKFAQYAATLMDSVYDNTLTPFTGSNPGSGTYSTPAIYAGNLGNVTFHFVNLSNQTATYQILGSWSGAAGDFGQIPGQGTGTVANEQADYPVGVNLYGAIIPYLKAQVTFGTAPTNGILKIIPVGRKVA